MAENKQNDKGIDILSERDHLVMDDIECRYGYQGILQYLEDSLDRQEQMADCYLDDLEDADEAKATYGKLKGMITKVIEEFQYETIA